MRFKRNRLPGYWDAYGDENDPITEVTGVGGYTGEVFPCPGDVAPRPNCAGPDGAPCRKLHAYTGTTQLTGHPESNTWSHATRKAATDAMVSVRRIWADEIKRGTR